MKRTTPTSGADLRTSELGVAFIMDSHVSRPNHVRADLVAAIAAAGPQPNANALDQSITQQYEQIRHVHNRAARNANINALGLNATHCSFAGW